MQKPSLGLHSTAPLPKVSHSLQTTPRFGILRGEGYQGLEDFGMQNECVVWREWWRLGILGVKVMRRLTDFGMPDRCGVCNCEPCGFVSCQISYLMATMAGCLKCLKCLKALIMRELSVNFI